MALTAKQKMFIENYLISLNATDAAVKAGYSKKTAMEQGYQLLQKTLVAEEIQKQMDKRSKRTCLTADYVIDMIRKVAETTEKDNDRLKACELLGKHLKLFTDKVENSGDMNINVSWSEEKDK